MDLFLAPHSDDETLWGAFTLLRNIPLVAIVTDSYIQQNRGENVTAEERWLETCEAMKILNCPVVRIRLRDDHLEEDITRSVLSIFQGFNKIYAPAIQGGNVQHDLVGKLADEIYGKRCKHYTTYTKTENYTEGNIEIKPTVRELKLKNKALACYKSQLGMSNKAYFEAVKGRSEWLC